LKCLSKEIEQMPENASKTYGKIAGAIRGELSNSNKIV
jgi:hypothetical protein